MPPSVSDAGMIPGYKTEGMWCDNEASEAAHAAYHCNAYKPSALFELIGGT